MKINLTLFRFDSFHGKVGEATVIRGRAQIPEIYVCMRVLVVPMSIHTDI